MSLHHMKSCARRRDGGKKMSERKEKFEKMLQAVQEEYGTVSEKMETLKAESKTKTATYRQMTGRKLALQNMLSLYQIYGLLD